MTREKKYKDSMTAAELMARLQADPDYQRRMAEKQRRRSEREAALTAIEQPILDDLQTVGVAAESIEEVTQRYAPLPPQVVQILLAWLRRVQDDRIKESLIRSLGAAKEPFDGRALVDCFMQDTSETLRWPIANTMAEARPYGIDDWLIGAVQNRRFGSARQMLVVALARIVPTAESLPILRSLLKELPGHVAIALGEIGGVAELNILESHVESVNGWEKAETLKAIRKIKKRLGGRR